MRHTSYSDYALRMLMYLAVHPERLCTIDEIARAYAISRNHLMKLAFELGRAGYIRTVRGRSGGLALARPAESIIVGEVIRHTEEDFALVECFRPERNECAITPGCRLRSVFASALAAYLSVLDGYTLADLTSQPERLTTLFHVREGERPTRPERVAAELEVEDVAHINPNAPSEPAAG